MYYSRFLGDTSQESRHEMKFFKNNSTHPGGYPWKWPFIDIFWYKEDDKEVWSLTKETTVVPKSRFYPLIKRPFGKLYMYSPYDALFYLKSRYRTFKCATGGWNHSAEAMSRRAPRTSCKDAYKSYPHVEFSIQSTNDHHVIETLKYNGATYGTFAYKGGASSVFDSKRPYGF